MRIKPKDVRKYLSLKGKIVITGKYVVSLANHTFNKFKKGFEKILPSEEVIQAKTLEVRENKTEKIDTKRNELKQFIGAMEQDDEYRIGKGTYYLNEVKNKLRKLDNRRIRASKKGLGVFTLTKLALSKIKDNIKNKWGKYLEKRTENKLEKEIEQAKEQLKENFEKLMQLKKEEQEILEAYPEIDNEEVTHVVTKIDDGEELEVTEICTKVTAIKNPNKEEKEKIKKSSNFKKALAAMTIITGIALGANALTSDTQTIDKSGSIDITDNSFVQVDQELDPQKEQVVETSIKLGNYLTIENGSTIYQNSELNGNRGIIGMNGYDDETLFKVNAITYIDENGIETTFNVVQKSEQAKKLVEEHHKKYIENNTNIKVKNFHITPCDELGVPISKESNDIDLGGWTNSDNAKIQNVDTGQVVMSAYQTLGGKVL